MSLSGYFIRDRWTLISIGITVPVGFFTKSYRGPAQPWVNDSLGGLFYAVFWCLVAYLFADRLKPWVIAVSVLIATCFLECLQLWHPPFLEYPRGFFIGRTVLGTSFSWLDFPYYIIGGLIGWMWIVWIKRTITAGYQ